MNTLDRVQIVDREAVNAALLREHGNGRKWLLDMMPDDIVTAWLERRLASDEPDALVRHLRHTGAIVTTKEGAA